MDKKLTHIAIRPTISGKTIEWDDTGRGLHFDFQSINIKFSTYDLKEHKDIVVQTENESFTLKFLTLEIYNNAIKSKVTRPPSFENTEDLQNYYLNTYFGQ